MKAYEDIKHMLCDEIKKIAKQGELTAGSLETLDKLTHSLKSIITIMAMEDEGYSYAGRNSRSSYAGRGRGGNSMNMPMRGSRGNYSYENGKDDMIDQLEEMLNMAESKTDKAAIERCIKQLEDEDE